MVINILDHIEKASTYEDGEVIFNILNKLLENNQDVTLSFKNINSVPSAFINSVLIRLLEHFNFEFIQTKLTITDSTKNINNLIKSRFEFVLKNQKLQSKLIINKGRNSL